MSVEQEVFERTVGIERLARIWGQGLTRDESERTTRPGGMTPFRQAGEVWTDPDTGFAFCWIPPGEFLLGAPAADPAKGDNFGQSPRVILRRGFWLGKYPVTQGQWSAVTGSNPARFQRSGEGAPVESVSWQEVQAFIETLNRGGAGERYRLPSEAEWEYACRAGRSAAAFSEVHRFAWCGKPVWGKTHPVGEKEPNAWGLCDMLGNVSEWVEDAWHDDWSGAPDDGRAWTLHGSAFRVHRGGSWLTPARSIKPTLREADDPQYRYDTVGFRLARDPDNAVVLAAH